VFKRHVLNVQIYVTVKLLIGLNGGSIYKRLTLIDAGGSEAHVVINERGVY